MAPAAGSKADAKKQKKTQENINSRLALVMKSGKYTLGYKTCLKTLRSGKGAWGGSNIFWLEACFWQFRNQVEDSEPCALLHSHVVCSQARNHLRQLPASPQV